MVCSSAAIIGGHDDLLTEILVLLPARSVVRFKSVSQHWRFLMSTESFTHRHIRRHQVETQHSFILSVYGRPQFVICDPTVKKLVPISLPPIINHQRYEYVKLLQSMNGLLLLSLKLPGEEQIAYVVFNPTTKHYRFIPLDRYQPHTICLIFDPSKSEYYKLLVFPRRTPNGIVHVSVYDSSIHQWSHKFNYPRLECNLFKTMLTRLFGFNLSQTVCNNIIVYFLRQGADLKQQIPEAEAYDNYVCDSNEHLNVLQLKTFREENKRCFRVGVLSGDNKWFIRKETTLDFGSSTVQLLGMIREKRIEDSTFLFQVPGQLLIYRFSENGDLEVLVDYRSDYFYMEDQLQFECAHPFIHTFAYV